MDAPVDALPDGAPDDAPACRRCTRLLRGGERWCPLCHEPAPDPRFRSGGRFPTTARTDDLAGPRDAPLRTRRHSRTAGSEVTFGPLGRLLVTLLVLASTVWAFLSSPVLGIAMVVVVLPWTVRDTWRRVRVPERPPGDRPPGG